MPDKQRELASFVSREVFINQTSLVEMLLAGELAAWDDIENLYDTCRDRGGDLCEGCQRGESCDEEEAREVFEWWLVSNWLADKLRTKGEPLLDTGFGVWWGRATTGQAIAMDTVIEAIYDEITARN